MLFAWTLNALALTFGAALGIRGLIDPHWAARFVRLKADEQGGGFAEFRATYGGVFLGLHAAALLLSLRWIFSGEAVVGAVAAGASAAVAAGWAGAAGGRAIAMWRDNAKTRFNMLSAGVEALMALLVGGPWVAWGLGATA
jgi:hypothetical protein